MKYVIIDNITGKILSLFSNGVDRWEGGYIDSDKKYVSGAKSFSSMEEVNGVIRNLSRLFNARGDVVDFSYKEVEQISCFKCK